MNKPPRIARWILSVTNRKSNREIILGDFEEFYDEICSEHGLFYADVWFYLQAIKSIPKFIKTTFYWGMVMFGNYVKLAIRNIRKSKTYSLINITGLALGIASCLLISIYIKFELSYDDYHIDSDRIYRVAQEFSNENGTSSTTRSGAPLGPTLKDNFPQVKFYARMLDLNPGLVTKDNISFYEDKQFYTDNDIFQILSIPFLYGDPKTALLKPGTIVLSESIAKKYFGNEIPLGHTLTLGRTDYEITGVVSDQPRNSHLHFNILKSLKTLEIGSNYPFELWFVTNFNTYLKLAPHTDAVSFADQIDKTIHGYYKEELGAGESVRYILQQVKDIHLYSQFKDELEPSGNPQAILIFAIVCIFILLIACINFINLATAKSAMRGKEIGVRKVAGAVKKQLTIQFLSETFILTLISISFAIILIAAVLPLFNGIAGTSFILSDFYNPFFIAVLIAISVIVTLTAGGYPAFALASFQPINALKGNLTFTGKGSLLRRVLVISQYTISILLVISSLIIYSQIEFMQKKNLGFNKEQKLIIPVRERIDDRQEIIKNEFLRNPSFAGATFSSTVPGRDLTGRWTTTRPDQPERAGVDANFYYVDPDFIPLYGLEVIAGRAFQKGISTDMYNPFIINETALKDFGWATPEEALGKGLLTFDSVQTIIGVVKDFNYMGLQKEVEPMILEWRPRQSDYLTLSVKPGNIKEALLFAEDKWNELFPGIPYEYFFLDNDFQRLYQSEENFGRLIGTFTALAFLIASFGLFGLASFMTERRTKEIGIRKVLGASVTSVVVLISKQFVKWIIVANIIAWPIAYYFMNSWIQNFAYRVDITLWLFVIAGVAALLIAVTTVGYQTIKAAIANPIDSIKYE